MGDVELRESKNYKMNRMISLSDGLLEKALS